MGSTSLSQHGGKFEELGKRPIFRDEPWSIAAVSLYFCYRLTLFLLPSDFIFATTSTEAVFLLLFGAL
jgi:hypothetical protein